MSRRVLLLLLPIAVLFTPGARAADGWHYFEGTAATVNKEVVFVSEVLRERCLLRCAAMPGSGPEAISLEEARERLIVETLALQEHERLELGTVDNQALKGQVEGALARAAGCGAPCAAGIPPGEIAKWVERKLLVRDFLGRRVGVFVEVKDEDVQRELQRRTAAESGGAGSTEEQVRRELVGEKTAREVRNWYLRAASKSVITLSPLEEK